LDLLDFLIWLFGYFLDFNQQLKLSPDHAFAASTKQPNGVNSMIANLIAFVSDEDGATAIEYGLIAALVSVAAIGALTAMGENLTTMFETVSSALSGATTP
jgi:pilus assembly protein Flp/PilA